jgi:hypothetical protein
MKVVKYVGKTKAKCGELLVYCDERNEVITLREAIENAKKKKNGRSKSR